MATLAQVGRRQGFIAQWLIAQWRDGLGLAVLSFVTLRLAFSLFGLVEATIIPAYAPCAAAAPAPTLYSDGLAFRTLGVWQRADGCMYEMIAALGYQPDDGHQLAFFPLYPLLLRAVSPLLAGSFTLGGMLVSGIAYVTAATGLYRLASRDFDSEIARRAVLYLSIFPSAFFLFAPFTESLFLALSVWTLYAARRNWWAWAGLLGLLAALTRTQGVFLALPLAWEGWRWIQKQEKSGRDTWRVIAASAGPVAGFVLFNAYVWHTSGMTLLQVQRIWGLRTATPWAVLINSGHYIYQRTSPVEATNLFLLLTCTTLLIVGLKKIPISYSLVCAPQLLLLLTRDTYLSPLMAVSRYLIVLFPAFIVLAILGQRAWIHRTWIGISLLLLTMLLIIFIGGPFVA